MGTWLLLLLISSANALLVLTTEKNLSRSEVSVFLASLRAASPAAKVVVFSTDPSPTLRRLSKDFNVDLFAYNESALISEWGPLCLHRFKLYLDFLSSHPPLPLDKVLLADMRDVVFQSDPDAIDVGSGIVVAVEPTRLLMRECPIHEVPPPPPAISLISPSPFRSLIWQIWLTENCSTYEREGVWKRIRHQPRVCAGTTMGTRAGILNYLKVCLLRLFNLCKIILNEALRTVEGGDGERRWCNDQGMHNKLLWDGAFSEVMQVKKVFSEDGPIVTVGTFELVGVRGPMLYFFIFYLISILIRASVGR
jgi:hypothetical protein